jgi:hypothetical protein
MEDATIVEVDELMFSAPPDGHDTRSDGRLALSRRHFPAQRCVMEVETDDSAADEVAAQLNHGAFYFRKLGHVR